MVNARDLMLWLKLYADEEGGRYPDRLETLVTSGLLEDFSHFESITFCQLPADQPPLPWIYVRGLSKEAPDGLPVLIAPRHLKSGQRMIVTNDTSAELMKPSQISKLLPEWKASYAALGIPLPIVLQEYDHQEPGTPPATK